MLRGDISSTYSKNGESQEQQDTDKHISAGYVDILTKHNTADKKVKDATQEEGAAVQRHADGEEESLDNEDVSLATESDTSEGQQATGGWCHGDLADVLLVDKDPTKQKCGEKEASEHADNPLPQNDEPKRQDDREKELPQGPEIALDTASFPLETNEPGQQAAGEEPLALETGIEQSSIQMMNEATDHNINLAPSETEDQLLKQEAITELLPAPAMKEELVPIKVISRSPEQRFNSLCGEVSFQPLDQEDGERLLPSEGVVKPFLTEIAEEHPRREDFDEPLIPQDEFEQDSADVIDQSSEQRRNSEVGSPRAESSASAATNESLPSKADIEQDPAFVTYVSSTRDSNTPQPENIAAPASISAEPLPPDASKIYHNASMQRLQMAVLEKRQQAVSYDKSSQFSEALDAYSQTLPLLKTLISRQDDTKEQNRCQDIYDSLASRTRELRLQEQPTKSVPVPMPFQASAATPSEISYPTPDTKAPEAAPQPSKLIMPASKPQASTTYTPSPQSAASQRLYKIWEAVRDASKPRRPTQSPASTASKHLPEPQATTTTTSTSTSQQPSKRSPAGPSPSPAPPHKATSDEQRKELYGDWTNSTLRNNYSDDEDEDIIATDSEDEDEYDEDGYQEDDPEYDDEYTGGSPDYDGEDPRTLW